ncbi:uncharacterized protein F5Z01DRAFT_318608 [Emericellopsis atlantica]|uniref:Uncharacterized protein n=1 Tax=Emericellopsis atlantica TaxID=2614577 RepID=A0A9P7ZUN2_9HYPO|nr:uncharacterized protein F5Z01DRAFT_318608 [Emericellopsis atlantica]KAG9258111.1 hypothetical protein F5Z01DRAFT_318608 [Emericellopsis atlantica]
MLIPRIISQSPRRLHVVLQTPRLWPHCTPRRHASSSKPADDAQSDAHGQQGETQGLPAPGQGVTLDMSDGDTSAKLSQLGPLVVNRDGTTGRVSNWETMTTHEQETTLRLLKMRNKARLDELKAKKNEAAE